MMLNSKSIGEKIAAARKNIHLSQADLAKQISISSQAVGKWERGESMPDIATLNRLAEILGVDLNYFSERFHTENIKSAALLNSGKNADETLNTLNKKPLWNLSGLNLNNSDFSGLKNLHEKLGSSNIQQCLFIGSEMSGLILKNNHVENSDFSDSDISNSQIESSMLGGNKFINSSLKSTKFIRSFIENCDFTGADLTGAEFNNGGFGKCTTTDVKWMGTGFIEMGIQDIVFEGILEDCRFENCVFYGVKFINVTLLNTFFKNNKKLKRVSFENCKVDKLTYAFLKNNLADLRGITPIS